MHRAPKITLFLVVMMLFLSAANAQNEGQYTHFMFNRLSYNPAYAGSSGNISLTALYRNQWIGFNLQAPTGVEEAGSTPKDILFSFDMPVKWLHGGIGLNLNSEKVGYHDNLNIALDYAFRIFWGPGNLAAAFEVDLYNYKFDVGSLVGSSDLDGNPSAKTTTGDPLVNGRATSDFLIDFSTGLYYQVPGLWYVSLSAKNLLGSKSEAFNFQNVRTFYLMAGYEYRFPYNPSFTLKPSMLVKTAAFSVYQADFACLVDYENIFWGGLGYRVQDAIYVLAGVQWKKVRVGASYDFTISRIGSFKPGRSMGSLELYLRFCFKVVVPQKPPTAYGNTIYLL